MDADKKPDAAKAEDSAKQTASADALTKTNEELGADGQNDNLNADGTKVEAGEAPTKEVKGFKKIWRKINIYALMFILVVVIGLAVAVVSYLNSKKTPKPPATANQSLSQDTLNQLANSDA